MKLQGVEILRLCDMQRFFDIEEFCRHRDGFARMLRDTDMSIFCDTSVEEALCRQLRIWCAGQHLISRIEGEKLILPDSNAVELGAVAAELAARRESIPTNDRTGLACLLALVGRGWTPARIGRACDLYSAMRSGAPIDGFMMLSENCELTPSRGAGSPLSRLILGNVVAGRSLSVGCGGRYVSLEHGECVTAILDSAGECVDLLPREDSDESGTTDIRLKFDIATRRPYAAVTTASGTGRIDEVCSIWIEPGKGPAYTLTDGSVCYDSGCFALRTRHKGFLTSHPDKTILAIRPLGSGSYKIYAK